MCVCKLPKIPPERLYQEIDELRARLAERDAELAERSQQLADAQETLRSLREGAARFPEENPSPVLCINRAGIVLYANPSSAVLCGGWKCEEGCPAPESFARLVRETLDDGQPRQVDVESGSRVFSFLFAPIADSGYVNLYGRDVSDRKQMEAERHKFVSLADQSTEFIGMCDMNFLPFYVNEAGRGWSASTA